MVVFSIHNHAEGQLIANFYNNTCPNVQSIVQSTMKSAVKQEPRMAASILRLFFHDCFVQGCDASVLLDDTSTFQGEKTAVPNNNSLRGFDVIDTIKTNVEASCPGVVSCADILALASRDGVVLSGGPSWSVLLGRRDSTTASLSLANTNLPEPTDDVNTIISKFSAQGLSVQDMVTLSGGHTIGDARCTTFKARLYGTTGNDSDTTLNPTYLTQLEGICPPTGGDDNVTALDVTTQFKFDNAYYKNLINGNGLLASDQELYSTSGSPTIDLVQNFSQNAKSFFSAFPTSMINMGNINPLTGSDGQIRSNCRVINSS